MSWPSRMAANSLSASSWRRKVGIAELHISPLGMQHAVADAVSLAAVAWVLDQANVRVLGM
jgi:hypothetical protein